jgi:hypothetical protein
MPRYCRGLNRLYGPIILEIDFTSPLVCFSYKVLIYTLPYNHIIFAIICVGAKRERKEVGELERGFDL